MRRILFFFIAFFSLTACESTQEVMPPIDIQVTQLSALIGGTKYIRDHCNRSDIPGDQYIEQGALSAARAKGWNTQLYNQLDDNDFLPAHRIEQRSKDIYISLTKDNAPLTNKCAELNSSLSLFIKSLHI